ncbi:hypothetical protein HPB47_020561 [Ixodes persulcatus]|uniref:Uncharacterized protein n=1 Tax=Ixodes persulcatus TaxID=34615 RepID=A0AC60QFC3_IXOPE|nr:hypothetical protein HPB47_020561 [Ixodes persulcatus]
MFTNYSAAYRDDMEPVIQGISLKISDCQKIGILGRTGTGKSSLALALFRLIEPKSGSITVDGIDIAQIGLHDLRSKMSIIPQDPVVFAGTLRWNLDPFGEHTDAALWEALERAHLKRFLAGQNINLDCNMTESGNNLSAGQKQLVCLARALLRQSKILVLDEATSSVDLETGHLVEETIRTEFRGTTIVTIAHTVHTVMGCDRRVEPPSSSLSREERPPHRWSECIRPQRKYVEKVDASTDLQVTVPARCGEAIAAVLAGSADITSLQYTLAWRAVHLMGVTHRNHASMRQAAMS